MKISWEQIGLVAGVVLPLWNLPLIVRISRRKTSEDISLMWAFGVWICILLLLPSALMSGDATLKAYGISNVVFFTPVVAVVLMYRKKR